MTVGDVICVSCDGKNQKPDDTIRYTFRNSERLPLCSACWRAALQVQEILRVDNKAEAARMRYEMKKLRGEILDL